MTDTTITANGLPNWAQSENPDLRIPADILAAVTVTADRRYRADARGHRVTMAVNGETTWTGVARLAAPAFAIVGQVKVDDGDWSDITLLDTFTAARPAVAHATMLDGWNDDDRRAHGDTAFRYAIIPVQLT